MACFLSINLKQVIEALDIYWYITYDGKNKDFPQDVERTLLQNHISMYGRLPRWNKKNIRVSCYMN